MTLKLFPPGARVHFRRGGGKATREHGDHQREDRGWVFGRTEGSAEVKGGREGREEGLEGLREVWGVRVWEETWEPGGKYELRAVGGERIGERGIRKLQGYKEDETEKASAQAFSRFFLCISFSSYFWVITCQCSAVTPPRSFFSLLQLGVCTGTNRTRWESSWRGARSAVSAWPAAKSSASSDVPPHTCGKILSREVLMSNWEVNFDLPIPFFFFLPFSSKGDRTRVNQKN